MGSLIQLIAYGAQDVYLTGNANITYTNITYRNNRNGNPYFREITTNHG